MAQTRYVFALGLLLCGSFAYAPYAQENQRFNFVSEYIRELAAVEEARELTERELADDSANSLMATIRGGTRMAMELGSHVYALKNFHFDKTEETQALIDNLISIYTYKIDLYQRMVAIAQQFTAGPQLGVDFGRLSAEMPTITARMEFLDKTLFQSTPLVFAALINPTPDEGGHMSRLVITKAQRAELVSDLTTSFGRKLGASNQNYIVSSAQLLKAYLEKDYRCTDE